MKPTIRICNLLYLKQIILRVIFGPAHAKPTTVRTSLKDEARLCVVNLLKA
jgi:hypothetical protein